MHASLAREQGFSEGEISGRKWGSKMMQNVALQ
jgi:hypothetical protein